MFPVFQMEHPIQYYSVEADAVAHVNSIGFSSSFVVG
jgi:hypothetical protein